MRLIGRYIPVLGLVVSVGASALATVESLGKHRALFAILGTSLSVVVATGAALVLLGWRTRRVFRITTTNLEHDQASSAELRSVIADHAFLHRELIPAFSDRGMEGTRRYFLDLVDRMDLSAKEHDSEARFVNEIAGCSDLATRTKIERLVDHFAERELTANTGDTNLAGSVTSRNKRG